MEDLLREKNTKNITANKKEIRRKKRAYNVTTEELVKYLPTSSGIYMINVLFRFHFAFSCLCTDALWSTSCEQLLPIL